MRSRGTQRWEEMRKSLAFKTEDMKSFTFFFRRASHYLFSLNFMVRWKGNHVTCHSTWKFYNIKIDILLNLLQFSTVHSQ